MNTKRRTFKIFAAAFVALFALCCLVGFAACGDETSVTGPDGELEETKTKLEETESELAETKSELEDTKSELDKTKSELEDAKAGLEEAEAKIEELESSSDSSSDGSSSDTPGHSSSGDLSYVTCYDGSGYMVTGIGEWTDPDLVIPAEHNGVPIVAIDEYAFSYYVFLTSVTIPGSVTSIGYGAFGYCTSLTSVTIEEGVTSIGSSEFYECTSLTSVTIPDSVTSIGSYAFYNCTSLASVTIPGSVTSIGSYAFYGCASLEAVYIPADVATIGSQAFYNCGKLLIFTGAVSQPNGWSSSWKSSESIVFWNMFGIPTDDVTFNFESNGGAYVESMSVPWLSTLPTTTRDGYIFTGWYADQDCSSESAVIVPYYSATEVTLYAGWTEGSQSECLEVVDGVVQGIGSCTDSILYVSLPIASYAFSECTQITELCLTDGCSSVASYAFYRCTALAKVSIGEGVTSIGSYSFYECSSLTSVTIPESVTSIGNYAFGWCTGLTEINYNATDANGSSSNRVFYYAGTEGNDLTVTIGSNVESIPSYLFYYSRITSVTIPESVTSIGYEVFAYCSSLTSVTIPEGVTSIGEWAFYHCSSLTSITIPGSVTSIGSYAFGYCTSLTSVTIPEGVTFIGGCAFEYCSGLTEIHYNATNADTPSSSMYVFSDAGTAGTDLTVTIGSNVESIPNYLFGCSNITSVVFEGTSCQSIESYAFPGCDYLSAVYYAGTSDQWNQISIGSSGNSPLTSATIYYYSEEEPAESGNWWHYVDGEPAVWSSER